MVFPGAVAMLALLSACQSDDSTGEPGGQMGPRDMAVAADAQGGPLDGRTAGPDSTTFDGGMEDASSKSQDMGTVGDANLNPIPDMLPDAAPRRDYAVVTDPLELTNAEAFACDDERIYRTPSRIWRLTNAQFSRQMTRLLRNEYRTVLGVSNPFDGIHSGGQFSQLADDFSMDGPTFDLLRQNATAVADYMTDAETIWLVPMCVSDADLMPLEACWAQTITAVARVAWRRPPQPEEIERYIATARGVADEIERIETFRLLIDAIIMSPNTYFRTELGTVVPDESGRHPLTPYEMASAISFGIQDGPPDEILAQAVANDELNTSEQIRRQVRRLLNLREDRKALPRFFQEFFGHHAALNVFKDPTDFPNLDIGSTVRSADHTIDYLVRRGGDSLSRLLTSNVFVPDIPLSCASCVDAEELGNPGVPIRMDPNIRAGLLTHPAWLIAFSRNDETDPVGRGKFVRERLLCQGVPDVPIGVIPQLPAPGPNVTMRDRLEAHSAPDCIGCHQLMDPIGLIFETYDHVGFLQTGPNSSIDPGGELVGAGEVDGPVANALELTRNLAESDVVRQCFTRTVFRFFMGRGEQRGDGCTLTSVQAIAAAERRDFGQLITALFLSDTFRYRRQTTPQEAMP